MRAYEIIQESNQQLPLHPRFNQDRGNLEFLVVGIEKIIQKLEDEDQLDLLDNYEQILDISKLQATQDWLDDGAGGGDAVIVTNDGFELEDFPVVVKYQGDYIVIDGHHRLNRVLDKGIAKDRVYLFDLGLQESPGFNVSGPSGIHFPRGNDTMSAVSGLYKSKPQKTKNFNVQPAEISHHTHLKAINDRIRAGMSPAEAIEARAREVGMDPKIIRNIYMRKLVDLTV